MSKRPPKAENPSEEAKESFARLDLLLLEKGLATTRTKAQDLIREGKVQVEGKTITRAGEKIDPQTQISLLASEHPYVSRGGLKLAAALEHFSLTVKGLRVLDVGQSTGGFTHCLLLQGAAEVVGIEVGQGQLDAILAGDARVRTFEKQDIRTLAPEQVAPPFEFFVVDLSFISLTHVLPVLPRFLAPGAKGIVLVKPQFEVGPEKVGSGGIVRDIAARNKALENVYYVSRTLGFLTMGTVPSPITGGDGNQEFLLYLQRI